MKEKEVKKGASWLKKPVIADVVKRFESVYASDKDQRDEGVKDHLFVDSPDGQWDDFAKGQRKDRPRYTVDRISGKIDQMLGNQRQTEIGIKAYPLKDGTKEVSEILNGLIRNIENESDAKTIYNDAGEDAIKSGYGGWRIITEEKHDNPFEQVARLRPIKSAVTSLFFDPDSEDYTKEDALWAFYIRDISIDSYKEKYKDSAILDFSGIEKDILNKTGWIAGDTVRIAEYWEKIFITRTVALLSDGRVIDYDEDGDAVDELGQSGVTIKKTKKIKIPKVQMTVINGAEILEDPVEWAGPFIPLIPVYGIETTIGNKKYVRGVVRKGKDAQRIYKRLGDDSYNE
jgi:hypothetical protein